MLQLAVFLALAFSIIIAIFAVQNTTPVTVSFLWMRAEQVPLAVLVLICASLGAGTMLLLGLAREIRSQLNRLKMARQLRAAEIRIQQLEAESARPAHLEPTELIPALPERQERPRERPEE